MNRPSEPGEQLLERESELATLDALIGAARDGDGRLALIEGRAGVGKSSLLAQARRLAPEQGLQVLSARGSTLERDFAFGVVRQLFEPLLIEAGERERLLAGAAAPAARIFESLDEEAGEASFAALHGLYWLTANVAASTPLLVAIDDLHWCDLPSLRFVVYLLRRLDGLPLLAAATLRSGETGPDAALLAEVVHDPATVAIQPAPLSVEAAGLLIRERLADEPDEPFRDACHHATGGNPLLMGQLLSSLRVEGVPPDAAHADRVRDIGPRAVGRTLLLRLARLPREWVAVARAVAVLGDRADPGIVAALAEVDERTLVEATRELARLDVLHARSMSFVHPLLRDAVDQDLSAAERELLHTTAARLLLEAGAPAQEVAAHLLLAPRGGLPHAATMEVLQEAARAARVRGAPESAVVYLRRALEEPLAPEVRPGIVFELGVAEALAVDPAAPGHLREAYDGLADPAQRAVAAQALAQTLLFSAPVDEATAFLQRAIEETPDALADERRMLEAMEIISIFFGARDWERIRAARRRTTAPGPGAGAKLVAGISAFDWAMSGGSADACAQLALDALADGELMDTDNGFIVVPAMLVLTFADRDEALDVWEQVIARARSRGAPWAIAAAEMWSGVTRLWRGDLPEAESLLRPVWTTSGCGHTSAAGTRSLPRTWPAPCSSGATPPPRALRWTSSSAPPECGT